MDQLPIELFRSIFYYIDQLPDLIRASLVCHYWRSHIMDDEDFLNKWFHQSLKFSRQSSRNHRQGLIQNLDQSLFPQNLQSSECHLLPLIDPFYITGSEYFFEQHYQPSLFDRYYSFSFWFFLPYQCELVVQINKNYVIDLHNCQHADRQWYFSGHKKKFFDDQWIHIVIANSESQTGHCIWLNGHDLNTFSLHRTFNKHIKTRSTTNALMLTCKRNDYSIQSPVKAGIADLVAFKRCLSLPEIRAIYQQQKCIDQVQVGTYMKKNERKKCTII
ncbi:unnamed protein product [Adineta steineri]|uniref:F-box domain-containing protein n=1 Tax=Adineta steineri TaxID=433720 RepID=A0A815QV20_9BILA|nr:unnamed protein product [Adineta steineri]CAF1466903.1 unnamed protein product [Adineta steineri]